MRIRILLTLGMVIILGCALSWAELTPLERLSSPEAGAKVALTISMDFKDANLKDILKIFSQQSGLNFIASEDIAERKVTLYLEGVSVSNALNSIISANNLSYEQKKDSNVFIVKESGKPKIATETRVFYLKYARVSSFEEENKQEGGKIGNNKPKEGGEKAAQGIVEAIEEILTENGNLSTDTRTNSLIITDIPSQFPMIEGALAKLDIKTPQVMIEVELLDTKLQTWEDLGLEFPTSVGQFTGPSRQTYFPFGKKLQTGATVTNTFTLGTLSLTQLSVVLDMLTKDTDTKILARPRILTLNNQPAEIKITADTAVGEITTSATEGITQTTEAERVETGISLKVTPQVSDDGYITMLIEPAVTDTQTGGTFGTTTYIDPHTRSARTFVRVKDAETIVIGGLIKSEDTETIKKVPWLGDIPFLGLFFRNKDIDREERELIIFITPHIVKEEVYLAELPAEELWFPGEREQKPSVSKEEAMEKALNWWEK